MKEVKQRCPIATNVILKGFYYYFFLIFFKFSIFFFVSSKKKNYFELRNITNTVIIIICIYLQRIIFVDTPHAHENTHNDCYHGVRKCIEFSQNIENFTIFRVHRTIQTEELKPSEESKESEVSEELKPSEESKESEVSEELKPL